MVHRAADLILKSIIFGIPVALVAHWCDVQPTWKSMVFVFFCIAWGLAWVVAPRRIRNRQPTGSRSCVDACPGCIRSKEVDAASVALKPNDGTGASPMRPAHRLMSIMIRPRTTTESANINPQSVSLEGDVLIPAADREIEAPLAPVSACLAEHRFADRDDPPSRPTTACMA